MKLSKEKQATIICSENIGKLCRICLKENDPLISMNNNMHFEDVDGDIANTNIFKVLQDITSQSIMVVDKIWLPTKICSSCYLLVKASYLFIRKYEKSKKLLQIYLNTFLSSKRIVINNEDVTKSNVSESVKNGIKDVRDREKENYIEEDQAELLSGTLEEEEGLLEQNSPLEQQDNVSKTKKTDKKAQISHLCPVCLTRFPVVHFRKHIKQHKELQKYVKISVGKVNNTKKVRFYTVNSKKIPSRHRGIKSYVCPHCNDHFFLQKFISHILKHEEDRSEIKIKRRPAEKTISETTTFHQCPSCTLEFTAKKLRKHVLTDHKISRKYFENAPKVPKTAVFYAENRKTDFDRKNLTVHKCPHCSVEVSMSDFRKHVFQHEKSQKHVCKVCGRSFRKQRYMMAHRNVHLRDWPHQCRVCNKGFVLQDTYEAHLLTHDTKKMLPLECDICLQRFSHRIQLYRHKFVHTEKRKYYEKYKVIKRCPSCLQTFTKEKDASEHHCPGFRGNLKSSRMREWKVGNKEAFTRVKRNKTEMGLKLRSRKKLKRTLCAICGKYVTNFLVHMNNHTGAIKYPCTVCNKNFLAPTVLKRHMLIHSETRPYLCSGCPKTFNNRGCLTTHEKIHSGVKPHACHLCPMAFYERSYLRKHLLVHAKNQMYDGTRKTIKIGTVSVSGVKKS